MQPLFYAAIALAAGIATAAGGGPSHPHTPIVVASWLALTIASVTLFVTASWRPRRAVLPLLAVCFIGGWLRGYHVRAQGAVVPALVKRAGELQIGPHDRVWLTGYLRDDPDVRADAVRFDLEADTISAPSATRGPIWDASGGVNLTSYPPSAAGDAAAEEQPVHIPNLAAWPGELADLRAGDGVAVSVHLRALRGYRDPGVPDLAAQRRQEGIVASASLAAGDWQRWPISTARRSSVARSRLWHWISGQLDAIMPPSSEPQLNAVMRGMLLGDVQRVDAATREDFQIDGAYHLLVVAGLHLGFLAALLVWVFRRVRLPRIASDAITLLLLASYAWMIAGRIPTLRVLLMLALYFGARTLYRDRQALNAVGGAALVLLIWWPLDLFTAGFQMSLGAATLLAGVALPMMEHSSQPWLRALRNIKDVAFDEGHPPRLAQFRVELRMFASRLAWIWDPLGWRILPGTIAAVLRLYDLLLISLVLQVGFTAFNVTYFHRASPWSVPANVFLVPAASVLIPAAWVVMAGHAAAAAMAPAITERVTHGFVAPVFAWTGGKFLALASWFAHLPASGLRVPTPPLWGMVLFGIAIMACVAGWIGIQEPRPGRKKWEESDENVLAWPRLVTFASTTAVAWAAVLIWCPFAPRLPAQLAITVLDVGQGDGIFVSFPDGRTLLVDGGPRTPHWDTGEEVIAPFLWSLGLHRIDAILLTHAHNDHLGGLKAILQDFQPESVWLTPVLPHDRSVADFLRLIGASGNRVQLCRSGDVFRVGGAYLDVLFPPGEVTTAVARRSNENEESLVTRVRYGRQAALLTGDLEAAGERWMLERGLPLQSGLLKVAHHGSATSSTPEFLATVQPQVAVISVGADNVYGHPSPSVLERLQQSDTRVFRTDRDGAVQCRMDGKEIDVYLFSPLPGQTR